MQATGDRMVTNKSQSINEKGAQWSRRTVLALLRQRARAVLGSIMSCLKKVFNPPIG
jgi:hypothetical protein